MAEKEKPTAEQVADKFVDDLRKYQPKVAAKMQEKLPYMKDMGHVKTKRDTSKEDDRDER